MKMRHVVFTSTAYLQLPVSAAPFFYLIFTFTSIQPLPGALSLWTSLPSPFASFFFNNMNSPELSLDMNLNLDSPSADADGYGGNGGEGGGGMKMNEKTNDNIIHRGTRYSNNNQDSRYYEISSSGIGGDNNYAFNDGNTSGGNGGGKGAKKIDCDKMTKTMEEWKDELSMMRVKNAILLDDLVKVGATNVV